MCTKDWNKVTGKLPASLQAAASGFLFFITRTFAMSTERTCTGDLRVATELYDFINNEVLPGTGVQADAFWAGFSRIVTDLAPKNAALLAERDRLQTELDTWHSANPGPIKDMRAHSTTLAPRRGL